MTLLQRHITSNLISKSFNEGDVYVDDAKNRKLGRVGQPYKHRYKLVADKEGNTRVAREKVKEGQLKVSETATHAQDTKDETIQITLTPQLKQKYNLLFNSLAGIRPPGMFWKEAQAPEKIKEYWAWYMPQAGKTKGNVRKVLGAIEQLEKMKRLYEFDMRLEKYGSKGPALYLAKKYLPKINNVLSQMEDLKKYMEGVDKQIDELESKNSKYKKIVGDKGKEEITRKRKEEWDKLSEGEKASRAMGYDDDPKSWKTTTGSSHHATWTGD
jgi:DNA repair ATPase RecN